MPFFFIHRNPDENTMYSYLCELLMSNNRDVPRRMDKWSKGKLKRHIYAFEAKYGPVESF